VSGVAWLEGNDGGVRRPGVVVGSSQRGVVVLGGAVLRVWSRWSERGWSGGPRQLSSDGYGGVGAVKWRRRKKRVLHGGGDSLYSC
jgi:hypothetical protein